MNANPIPITDAARRRAQDRVAEIERYRSYTAALREQAAKYRVAAEATERHADDIERKLRALLAEARAELRALNQSDPI